jgi:hypothetical protein
MTSGPGSAAVSGQDQDSVVLASFESYQAAEHMVASLGREFRKIARKGGARASPSGKARSVRDVRLASRSTLTTNPDNGKRGEPHRNWRARVADHVTLLRSYRTVAQVGVSAHIGRLRAVIGHELLLLPSVSVLPVDEAGRVLLVRQAGHGDGWAVLGGAVEIGESPAETAVREAREEIGTEVRLTRLLNVLGGPTMRSLIPMATGPPTSPPSMRPRSSAAFPPPLTTNSVMWRGSVPASSAISP